MPSLPTMPTVSTDLAWSEPAARDWSFPRSAAGVTVLVEYAVARGIPARTALRGTGLSAAGPAESGEVTAAQELAVVRTLRSLLGEVGTDVGATYRAESFGVFGYALVSSPTLRDAVDVTLRYIDLSNAFAILQVGLDAGEVVMRLDDATLPRDVARFLIDRDLEAIRVVLESLLPGGVGSRVRRTDHGAELRFATAELDRPLPQGGAQQAALGAAVCAEVVDRRRARTGLAKDVRVLITQRLPSGAPLADVAADLAMSERTLRRHLAAEDTSYRQLLDEVRSSLAEAWLDGSATMPVTTVAARLGYASAAAFCHARARWRR